MPRANVRVLPSSTDARIATRYVTRHKPRQVTVIEAEVKKVDVRTLFFTF